MSKSVFAFNVLVFNGEYTFTHVSTFTAYQNTIWYVLIEKEGRVGTHSSTKLIMSVFTIYVLLYHI